MAPTQAPALLLAAAALLAAPQVALAHRLNVFAFEEGGQVHVETYFSRGAKARGATVSVYGSDGARLLSLTADPSGACTFAPPGPGRLTLVAETSDGHRAEFVLERDGSAGRAEGAAKNDSPAAVHREIRQLRAEIRKLRKERTEVSARDVVAGLGLVFGLTALVAHLVGRRSRERDAR